MALPLWSDTKIHLDGDGWVLSVSVTPAVRLQHLTPVIFPLFTQRCSCIWHFVWMWYTHSYTVLRGMTICSVLLLRGFTVNTAGRTHVFKPVSVQAMWWVINNLWRHSGCLKKFSFMTHNNKSPDEHMCHSAAAVRRLQATLSHSATCWHKDVCAETCCSRLLALSMCYDTSQIRTFTPIIQLWPLSFWTNTI